MNTDEIQAFLASHPPFDALEPDDPGRRGRDGDESRATRRARRACVEDAAPAEHLFVVRDGSMELVHEGEVVDVLEPGESFGHPSLLTRARAGVHRAGPRGSRRAT